MDDDCGVCDCVCVCVCGVCDQKVPTSDQRCAEWKIMTDSLLNSNLSFTIVMHCSADLFSFFPIFTSRLLDDKFNHRIHKSKS